MTSRPRLLLAVVAGLAAMLLYAGQFVLSRWTIQRTLSLWDLAALRFASAGLLLLPVVLRHGLASGGGVGWARSVALTITAGGPYTLIMFAGLRWHGGSRRRHHTGRHAGGQHGARLALFGERPWPSRLGGTALVVAGLALVGWPGISDAAGERTWLGDVLFVVAGVLWGLFTVLARRWQLDPLRATAMTWVLALAYLPFYALSPTTGC